MKVISLKFTTLAAGALMLFSVASNADTPRTVTCANGKTVQASGTESDSTACLTIGSRPAENKAGLAKRSPADEAKAKKYEQLARANKPRTPADEKLVKEYMKLPASQRNGFKNAHPGVSKSIWDLGPYAVCFYASVAGGADVVEAGDECHADWVE